MTPLRHALGLLGRQPGRVGLAVTLGAAAIGASVGLMGTSAWLISKAALLPSIAALQVAVVGVRFFGIARGVFRYLERLVSHDVTFRLLAALRVDVFRALVPLAPARFIAERSGDLLTRLVGDVDTLEHIFVRVIGPTAGAAVLCLLTATILGAFDGRLAVVAVSGLALAGTLVPWLAWGLGRRAGADFIAQRADLQASLVEGLRGMDDLIAFGRGPAHLERLGKLGRGLARSQMHGARASAVGSALAVLAADLTAIGVLVAAIPLVRAGQLSGVSLAVVTLVALAAFEAVATLPATAQHLSTARAAAARVFVADSEPPPVPDAADPAPVPRGTRLAVRGLSFSYPGSATPALEGLDLDLGPGSLTALVGPSGSGKSTLAHLLLRFWEIAPDTIFIDGVDVRDLRADDVRGCFGFVAQGASVFTGTVRENLRLASPSATEADLRRALLDGGLADVVARLPQGLDTWVGEQGARLSGGERQRLALARALLAPGQILVLDEPIAHLDPLEAQALMARLARMATSRAVLLITHSTVGLEQAREIVVLRQGRVVERGAFADLMRPGRWLWQMRALERDRAAAER